MTERDADREAAVEAMADAMFDCYGGYNEETRRHMKMMAMSGLQSQARRGLAALTAAGFALIPAAELAALRARPDIPARHSSGLTWPEAVGLLDEVFRETAEEIGVPADNEAVLAGIAALRAKLAEVEAERDAAVAAEREACAQIAAGEPYRERYRTWSFMTLFPDGSRGNENTESGKVWIADRIAEAIRARAALPAGPAAGQDGEAGR